MKEKYRDINFKPETLEKITRADEIISEYRAQGYKMTVRQIYYQFVRRGWIPNAQNEYKKLGTTLKNARYSELLDWSDFEDRVRKVRGGEQYGHEDIPDHIFDQAEFGSLVSLSYFVDLWAKSQNFFPEIWVEKNAQISVVERIAKQWRIPFFSGVGYCGTTAIKEAAERLAARVNRNVRPIIFYLGDHDPSGIDMDRDLSDRLGELSRYNIDVRRIALTTEQVEEFQPPANPDKVTDTRFYDYIAKYGHECWELDALEPSQLHDIINTAIKTEFDQDAWDTAKLEVEKVEKQVKDAADIINDAARKAAMRAAEEIKTITIECRQTYDRDNGSIINPGLFRKQQTLIDKTPWQKPAPPPKRTDLLETGLLERLGLGLKRREPIVRRV
jgi:hypothetical protein